MGPREDCAQDIAVWRNTEKTQMQFLRDGIQDCLKNVACAWSGIIKKWVNSIWTKTFNRFLNDFKGFVKGKSVVKAVRRKTFRWGDNGMEGLLEMPRERETAGVTPRKITVKNLEAL
jgi:hypothetical protein